MKNFKQLLSLWRDHPFVVTWNLLWALPILVTLCLLSLLVTISHFGDTTCVRQLWRDYM